MRLLQCITMATLADRSPSRGDQGATAALPFICFIAGCSSSNCPVLLLVLRVLVKVIITLAATAAAAMTDVPGHVLEALRNSNMGRLRYDRDWEEQGRVIEIINDIRARVTSLTISPCVQSDDDSPSVTSPKIATAHDQRHHTANYLAIVSRGNNGYTKQQSSSALVDKQNTSASAVGHHARTVAVNRSNSHIFKSEAAIDNELGYYENARQEKVKAGIESRANEIYSHIRDIEDEAEAQMRSIRSKHLANTLRRIKTYEDESEKFRSEVSDKQNVSSNGSDSVQSKLREVESKHKQVLAELENVTHLQCLQQIQDMKGTIEQLAGEILDLLDPLLSSPDTGLLNYAIEKQSLAVNLLTIYSELLTNPSISDHQLAEANDIKCNLANLKNLLLSDTSKLTDESLQQTQLLVPLPSVASISATKAVEIVKQTPKRLPAKLSDVCIKEYIVHQAFITEFEKSLEPFVADISRKPYRLTLQQFIRTTINTISAGSNDFLKQKYQRLSDLFEGRVLEFQDKRFKATEHPDSLNFSLSWAAKTFLSVGSKQVQSVPKAAFPMAAIIALLWQKFPMFGRVFLGHLYEKCPYLVGYIPVKEQGDTDADHKIACGYVYGPDNETLESEESYVNRMRALTRIYGAVMQSNLQDQHPHGSKFTWVLLSKLLNSEPQPGLTAAVLHALLTTVIFKMNTVYKNQMWKLIQFISSDYIKRIETNSVHVVKKQSIAQLKLFIEDAQKKLRRNAAALKPEGVLPDFFFQKSWLHSASAR